MSPLKIDVKIQEAIYQDDLERILKDPGEKYTRRKKKKHPWIQVVPDDPEQDLSIKTSLNIPDPHFSRPISIEICGNAAEKSRDVEQKSSKNFSTPKQALLNILHKSLAHSHFLPQ